MDSDSAHLLDSIEDGWWDSVHGRPSVYHELPPSSLWICRLHHDPKSLEPLVQVQIENSLHVFPRYYLSLFMLVEIHQLCSLAVSMKWPATSDQHVNALKNVHFVDCLRQHLLKKSNQEGTLGKPVDQRLKRLIIRIMKKITHKALHGNNETSHEILYAEYDDDSHWHSGDILLRLRNSIHFAHIFALYSTLPTGFGKSRCAQIRSPLHAAICNE